jgi:hypothetical protein
MCPYLGSLASVELMKGDNPFPCHTIQGSVARAAIVSHLHFCLLEKLYECCENVSYIGWNLNYFGF